MDTFIWPFMLLLLPLPFLVRRFLRPSVIDNETGVEALRAPFFQRATRLGLVSTSSSASGGSWLLLTLGWICLVVAGMRPVTVGEAVVLPQEARNMMLAIDVSGSMAASDFDTQGRQITRLDMVKRVADDFIKNRSGDRIGLVLFGTEAYVYAPLSLDTETLRQLFSEVGVGIAGDMTAIGDALALAVENTASVPADSRIIILLSDGKSNAGVVSVSEAVALAQKHQAKVYTVGMGSDARSYQDFFGLPVLTSGGELDEETLKEIATATGGQYFRAKSTADLKTIYDTIDALETTPDESHELRPQKELFYLPLTAALIFFGLVFIKRRCR